MDGEITRLLHGLRSGDAAAEDRLLAAVYQEIRGLAIGQLRREHGGHTLEPTELVHEAYMRLVPGEAGWQNRAHFFGAASRAMRRVLVEHARRRGAGKRGSGRKAVTFSDLNVPAVDPGLDLLELDMALTELEALDPRLSQVVHLRYFAGCSIEETAELLGVSIATVKRDWTYARAWLLERLSS
jgi:RNA polymerase sigma factor (TIGR02999 family)